jgi:hypothetical protein
MNRGKEGFSRRRSASYGAQGCQVSSGGVSLPYPHRTLHRIATWRVEARQAFDAFRLLQSEPVFPIAAWRHGNATNLQGPCMSCSRHLTAKSSPARDATQAGHNNADHYRSRQEWHELTYYLVTVSLIAGRAGHGQQPSPITICDRRNKKS